MMWKWKNVQVVAIVLSVILTNFCLGDQITVGKGGWEDFDNIQGAINFATDGDVIEAQPGLYQENINFDGKNITLTSLNPSSATIVNTTIIDGGGLDSVVKFAGTETASCVLTGFTIQGGSITGYGGGIRSEEAGGSPYAEATVSYCVITGREY